MSAPAEADDELVGLLREVIGSSDDRVLRYCLSQANGDVSEAASLVLAGVRPHDEDSSSLGAWAPRRRSAGSVNGLRAPAALASSSAAAYGAVGGAAAASHAAAGSMPPPAALSAGRRKACAHCRQEGGVVTSCDGCGRMYHLHCVGLTAHPKGIWVCPPCAEQSTHGSWLFDDADQDSSILDLRASAAEAGQRLTALCARLLRDPPPGSLRSAIRRRQGREVAARARSGSDLRATQAALRALDAATVRLQRDVALGVQRLAAAGYRVRRPSAGASAGANGDAAHGTVSVHDDDDDGRGAANDAATAAEGGSATRASAAPPTSAPAARPPPPSSPHQEPDSPLLRRVMLREGVAALPMAPAAAEQLLLHIVAARRRMREVAAARAQLEAVATAATAAAPTVPPPPAAPLAPPLGPPARSLSREGPAAAGVGATATATWAVDTATDASVAMHADHAADADVTRGGRKRSRADTGGATALLAADDSAAVASSSDLRAADRGNGEGGDAAAASTTQSPLPPPPAPAAAAAVVTFRVDDDGPVRSSAAPAGVVAPGAYASRGLSVSSDGAWSTGLASDVGSDTWAEDEDDGDEAEEGGQSGGAASAAGEGAAESLSGDLVSRTGDARGAGTGSPAAPPQRQPARPGPPLASAAGAAGGASGGGDAADDDVDTEMDAPWQCPQCTFSNHCTRAFCAMCRTPHPQFSDEVHTVLTPYGALTVTSASDQPAPRGGGAAAAAAASAQHSPAVAALAASRDWACGACTFSNSFSATRCAVCDAPRPLA